MSKEPGTYITNRGIEVWTGKFTIIYNYTDLRFLDWFVRDLREFDEFRAQWKQQNRTND